MSHRAYVVRLWCGCYLCRGRGRGEADGTHSLAHATHYKRIEAERVAAEHAGAVIVSHTEAREHPWCQYREERRA